MRESECVCSSGQPSPSEHQPFDRLSCPPLPSSRVRRLQTHLRVFVPFRLFNTFSCTSPSPRARIQNNLKWPGLNSDRFSWPSLRPIITTSSLILLILWLLFLRVSYYPGLSSSQNNQQSLTDRPIDPHFPPSISLPVPEQYARRSPGAV